MSSGGKEGLLTVGEALKRTIGFFERYQVDEPRLDAEVLLSHVLGLERIELYINYQRPLDRAERDEYRQLVAARARRKPVAYLTGEKEFMSLKFYVNEEVLIPRPETELLVEMALDELKERTGAAGLRKGTGVVRDGERERGAKAALSLLELGTGSGAVAVSVAHFACRENFALGGIIATDICQEALSVARKNAERHEVAGIIRFLVGDLFTPLEGSGGGSGHGYDIICSNPPYIPEDMIAELQPEIQRFEPHRALAAGQDGLDFYRRIADGVRRWLNSDGVLLLELGKGQGEAVSRILSENGLITKELREDHSGTDRVIKASLGPG